MIPRALDGQVCSTAFCVLRPDPDEADPEFVFFATSSEDFVRRVSSHQRGSSYPAVTDRNVLDEEVLLPSLAEQRAIARVIRAIREERGATDRVIAATRELKRSLTRHLFTYGPVPVADTESVELQETEIGLMPKHWRVTRLDELSELLSGGTPSKSRQELWMGSIPWVSGKDLKRYRLVDTEDHITEEAVRNGSRIVPAGTILILVRGMGLARDVPIALTEVPMAFNQDLKAIVPRGLAGPDYLLYALLAHKGQLRREIGTSAHGTRRIGTSGLAAFRVPVPSLEEQEAIAAALSTVERRVDTEISRRDALQQVLTSALAELMTGQRRVATQEVVGG